MTKAHIKIPNGIFNKAISVFKMQRRQREIMQQIDEWLEAKGYDVEEMRYRDSFQALLENGDFESEEVLVETIKRDLADYFPK